MRCKFVFKGILLAALLLSCEELARDNPLDPKNPESHSRSVLLAEAFVNTVVSPAQYNAWALAATEEIQREYENDVIVVQYHRDILQDTVVADDPYNDFDPGLSAAISNLQKDYVDFMEGPGQGVPDIFINGTAYRVSGASSQERVQQRLSLYIESQRNASTRFVIQPEVTKTGNGVRVSCRVVPLGNQDTDPMLLKIIFLKDFNQPNFRYVAIGLVRSIQIKKISAGNYWQKDLGDYALGAECDMVVFALTDEEGLQHYQSVRVDLN